MTLDAFLYFKPLNIPVIAQATQPSIIKRLDSPAGVAFYPFSPDHEFLIAIFKITLEMNRLYQFTPLAFFLVE